MIKSHGIRSKGVLLGVIGLLALAVSAAAWGITNLGASDTHPGTVPTPSPEKIAQIRQILFQDEAVKGILAGRHEGRDYWMRIDPMYERENVEKKGEPNIAAVYIWFDPAVTWEGEVPTRSDPCKGHYDDDGYLVDKNDPCIYGPREYGTSYEKFDSTHGISPFIDLRLGRVYAIASMGGLPDAIRQAKKLYATPGSPEQDAKVREILFQHEAIKSMTSGREEGESFWVDIVGYIYAPDEPLTSEEKTIAIVDVYFDPVLKWSGSLPTQLEPCQREHEQAIRNGRTDWPDRADPCWSAPPQYETRPDKFSNGEAISVDIDLRSGQVLQITGLSTHPGDLDNAKKRLTR